MNDKNLSQNINFTCKMTIIYTILHQKYKIFMRIFFSFFSFIMDITLLGLVYVLTVINIKMIFYNPTNKNIKYFVIYTYINIIISEINFV